MKKKKLQKSETSEYSIWVSMKSRCCRPKDPAYHRYAGRGIKVCDRWLHSFDTFLADMEKRPSTKQPSQAGRADKSNDHVPARAESVIQQWHFDDATVERASRAAWPKTWAIIDESPQGCMPNVIARRAITRQKMMDDMRRALFAASPPQPDRNTGEANKALAIVRALANTPWSEWKSRHVIYDELSEFRAPTQTEEEV